MLQYLKDKVTTARLRARYQRIVHERLVELTESAGPRPVSEEPGDWHLVGGGKGGATETERIEIRDKVRQLVRENPHACQILRMLEAYVTGPGLTLAHQPVAEDQSDADRELASTADRLWSVFQTVNLRHYSFREHARRSWRDGECFVRKFAGNAPDPEFLPLVNPGPDAVSGGETVFTDWPPAVRFVDPETIGPTAAEPDSQGIVTDPRDVERPLEYLRIRPGDGELIERIPAAEILQTRVGVDSNEKRGVSLFAPILEGLNCFEKWMETELLARKLQSSIVLWRKVQGSPQMAESLANQSAQSSGPWGDARRERVAPGTILTTNHGTEIQFLQPNTNFGDAVSLGRMVLLSIAAGAGLPEFMLTSDASNANFASTMVAEGPAVKFFQNQQQLFSGEFTRLWRWIMADAIDVGLLPEDFFDRMEIRWSFPSLINRDRPKERLADVRLVESGILSRAEVARRDGVDPHTMRSERERESSDS
jgi:capsid protein